MKNAFAQSMAWLHTWAGLVAGWPLFVIFVGGTLACFDTELSRWMRPGMNDAVPDKIALASVIDHLVQDEGKAHAWYLYLPTERYPAIKAGVFHDDGRFHTHSFNADTGARLQDTAGGEFFFTLHYNLHAGVIGMYLVGLAGMMMLVAIVTGIVIHKRIFKDFFLLRFRSGGQRAWLDGHNLTGVLGLPFHLLIAYTGVGIFVTSYMLAGFQMGYGGNIEKFFDEVAPHPHREQVHSAPLRRAPLQELIADAQQRLRAEPWIVAVEHPGDASMIVSISPDHRRHVAWNWRTAYYDGVSGEFLQMSREPPAAYHVYTFLGGLHMVQYGGGLYRWLYFLLGLSGCVMLGCGMQVWVNKRAKRVAAAGVVSGYGLVRALNVGVVTGLPFAVVAMLWANRLLGDAIAERAAWEIRVFCGAWILAVIGSWLRLRSERGWRDLFAATALLFLGLPVLSLWTAPAASLAHSLREGVWRLASVDLTLLAFGLVFAWLARVAHRRGQAAPEITEADEA